MPPPWPTKPWSAACTGRCCGPPTCSPTSCSSPFEGGSLLRALLLLLAFPLVWALGPAAGLRVMTFLAFAGLRPRDAELVARAVLPKHYLEALNAVVYDRLWLPARRRVVVTSAPRVMSECFLKEYLAAAAVIGWSCRW
ncbi:hypothetical protein PR202_gb18350 [Eleusine coracana subsp. coracana]|uniref:Glycerol-3-phosphate acyltransferase RAM2/GPAT1-8 HAD-like domain-containing protein n=1 Tax=Eleusine coracana subsp. coracana TaxID=191504 RepID=A0AAV5F5E0_ELECO|nr:hypothetical protein PR202_gb18350 [Eleusine coracana subsp. coracana]